MMYPSPALPAALETMIDESVRRFRAEWPAVLKNWAETNGKIEAYRIEITDLVRKAYNFGRFEEPIRSTSRCLSSESDAD